ncbi:MAG: Zn-dependent hydrolase [Rhizobiaceae bacterium]
MTAELIGHAADRFRRDFEEFALIGRLANGGMSRPAFSPYDCEAHERFLARAREAGFSASYDPFGNAVVRMETAGGADMPALVIGSHLDTVENGGAFDGALGVIAGLEVLRRVSESGGIGRPLEVIAFRDEEGRFGPFTGSRAFTGALPLDRIGDMRSADGVELAAAMREAGFEPGEAADAIRNMATVHAYLELHIEQGSVLQRAGVPLGVVTAIVGQERMSVKFLGQADHAGTTPMELRRDAFAAAARFADRFRDMILSDESPSLRGTIGIVRVSPNQGNVVPDDVRLNLEIRDADDEAIDRSGRATERLADEAARTFGVSASCRTGYRERSVAMDGSMLEALEASAAEFGIRSMRLPSGANHDAGLLARQVRGAMLFVPSKDGRSHCPQEHTDWAYAEQAVQVMEAAVRRIADQP